MIETVLNNQLNNQTVLNPNIIGETVLNYEMNDVVYSNETIVNTEITLEGLLSVGSIIDDKYVIKEKMNTSSGEADLYICEYNSEKYVLKRYKRQIAIKDEIVEQLKHIDSPFVAKIYDTGVLKEYPYEILHYYEKGSLQNKTFSLDELKNTIIPDLNEGLKVLHDNGILHKDIKPSNIMLCDNGKDVAIIDFGISSYKNDGNSIVMTKTGFTPEYSAPETFRNLFLDASDYYSLGVTIYELYMGTTPYKNMSPEEIAQMTLLQKLFLPKEMDEELGKLISSLTYIDITTRTDSLNPNRRWGYEEVNRWCQGKEQSCPGDMVSIVYSNDIAPYSFMDRVYTSRRELALSFARNWKEGRKQLFNDILARFFASSDPAFSSKCKEAEEDFAKGRNSDLIFYDILYELAPTMKEFVWKDRVFKSLECFGKEVYSGLIHNNKNMKLLTEDILKNRIISKYIKRMDGITDEMVSAVQALEMEYLLNARDVHQRDVTLYKLGYMLSGERTYLKKDEYYKTVEDLRKHMTGLIEKSYLAFEEYALSMIDKNGNLDPQFEAWLIAINKRKELENWKQLL